MTRFYLLVNEITQGSILGHNGRYKSRPDKHINSSLKMLPVLCCGCPMQWENQFRGTNSSASNPRQAGLFSAIPLAGCYWALSQGGTFRAHLAISPLYNSHVWVISMSSSGRPVENKCTEIIFNVVLFIICANVQYPKLFRLELCFYQFCNKPQCNSFNFYMC